jgi:hypothetical protein
VSPLVLEVSYPDRFFIVSPVPINRFWHSTLKYMTTTSFRIPVLPSASFSHLTLHNTEHRGRVVNTPASYSVGSRIKSQPGDRLSWLRPFAVFLSPSRKMPGKYLKIRPWPLPSKSFPIHHSFITDTNTLSYWWNIIK